MGLTKHNSDQRALLIEKLIELRSEVQETKGVFEDEKVDRKLGHEFVADLETTETTCEQCLNIIWSKSLIRRCISCGFLVHSTCINSVSRRCGGLHGKYEMAICPEIGLSQQKYRCQDCRCRIAKDPNLSVSGS